MIQVRNANIIVQQININILQENIFMISLNNFFSGGLSSQFINGEFLFLLNDDSTETYDVQLTRDVNHPFLGIESLENNTL